MAAIDDRPQTAGEVQCSYHPEVTTGLRCSRCGKPICPRCAVRTPVGLRCPDCAGVRGLPTYATNSSVLVRAGAAGLALAVVIGIVWGFFPEWGFYLGLALGFGVAELMARLANNKRGLDLQVLAIAIVLVGLIASRYVIATRFGIDLGLVNQMDPRVLSVLRLNIIPDLVFAAIPLVIAWIRFR
jgi:hypothetical protein